MDWISPDEFAEIEIPNMWKGWRNPVIYRSTDDLEIDFESLDFKPTPARDMTYIQEHLAREDKYRVAGQTEESGISIQEAKRLLSIRYEIDVENIEITLKG